jgi:hypothetical protein
MTMHVREREREHGHVWWCVPVVVFVDEQAHSIHWPPFPSSDNNDFLQKHIIDVHVWLTNC